MTGKGEGVDPPLRQLQDMLFQTDNKNVLQKILVVLIFNFDVFKSLFLKIFPYDCFWLSWLYFKAYVTYIYVTVEPTGS